MFGDRPLHLWSGAQRANASVEAMLQGPGGTRAQERGIQESRSSGLCGAEGGRCSDSSLKTFDNQRLLSQAGVPGPLLTLQDMSTAWVLHGLKNTGSKDRQDRLHNLQNEDVGPLVQELRISRQGQQSIKPGCGDRGQPGGQRRATVCF